jgi:multiple sugar transport system permease protein
MADAWEFIPFVTLVLLAGLKSLPYEPYEAAYVDGATANQRFFYITLPLLRPSVLVAVVIRTLTSLRVFDIVFIMTGGGPGTSSETLAFYGYRMAFQSYNIGFSSTINMLTFGIAIVFTLIYMKIIGGGKNYE